MEKQKDSGILFPIITSTERGRTMFLDTASMHIDFAEFDLIPEARRPVSGCAVNVSPSGQISLNKRLMEEIRTRTDSLHLGFACSRGDKQILLLFPTDHPNYTFPSSGSRKDTEFTQSLVAAGIALPARYVMTWNEGASAWVGALCGGRSADPLEASLKAGQSGGRRKK